MSSEQINITIGTAGHIDHGKTALVKCLTGCDTDRLKAEKERGMSIDLGFAPCTIAGMEAGIVDVPGHEGFVKTMVAGAAGMDAVLLVVAADDGVMPQTREHLDILTLLGVQHGLVALTKIDRVEADFLELVHADLESYLQGTFLENAPILPVSSVTGEGFDGFFTALVELMRAITAKPIDGVFRLPLDRTFSAKGHGTVVAGIPVSGSAHVGDEVVLLPQELSGRIRSIEVYGRASDTVKAGQCAALNVRHWDQHSITRGNTLTVPGFFTPQQWYACSLRLLPHHKTVLKNGANVKFHTGTAEVVASVYSMKETRLKAGDEDVVQIRTSVPVVAGPGDRFILRTMSPVQTVGGGTIIEGLSKRLRRGRPKVYDELKARAEAVQNETRFVEYCVKTAPALAASGDDIAFRAKVPRDRIAGILEGLMGEQKVVALAPTLYIHSETLAAAERRLLQTVGDFHQSSPESPGITSDALRDSLQIDKAVFAGIIARLKGNGRLVEGKGRLAAPEHEATFQQKDAQLVDRIEAIYRECAFCPPGPEELAEKTGADGETIHRIQRILLEHQNLVRVAQGLLFHREAVDNAREILTDFIRKEGKLESVRFKYLLDTTRKFAIPLLDYFDHAGVIRRSGNTRYLKTR